ncbi:hypothetical protein TPAU25S_00953 [Tsukamurella paurometabola]
MANYREWLKRWGVHFVVLPKDEPDGDGGQRERELVQRGLPYLKQIWGDANWQLFAVDEPSPLAEPNTVVERAEQGEWTLRVEKAGRILIRMPYSPWLGLAHADGEALEPPQETEESEDRPEGEPKTYENVHGCLMETEEDADGDRWTMLLAPEPGDLPPGGSVQVGPGKRPAPTNCADRAAPDAPTTFPAPVPHTLQRFT